MAILRGQDSSDSCDLPAHILYRILRNRGTRIPYFLGHKDVFTESEQSHVFLGLFTPDTFHWLVGDMHQLSLNMIPASGSVEYISSAIAFCLESCLYIGSAYTVINLNKLSLLHSDQLLSASRMYSNTAIKVLLSGAHLDSDTEALQHFTNAKTQDVQSDNLLLGTGTDNLHLRRVLGLLLSRHDVEEHGGELGVVDLDLVIAVVLAGLGLSETDTANLRVREDDRRDVLVRKLGGLKFRRTEEAAAKLAASSNCNYTLILAGYFQQRKSQ